MKKIVYFISGMALIVAAAGCLDEDRVRIPEHQTGANLRIVLDPQHSLINSTQVATDFIAFTAYSENKDLDKVEIFIHYKEQVHLFGTYSQADFANESITGQFNGADLAGWFNVPGFADGSRGGNFTIRPRVTLNDGRVYPGWVHLSATDSISNLGTGITGNSGTGAFTVARATAILCPPLDISGTYRVVSSSGTSTDPCCPGVVTVSGNIVTVTATNQTTFRVSDFTGGLYLEWYDVYGITSPNQTPGNLNYNCQEVSFVSTNEYFGTAVQGGGTYDPDTGILTYTWSNGFADEGEVVLEKQ